MSSAVVGIGAGISALFLCAACFIVYQIYKRKREHNREIAEIEQGFPPARPVEVAQVHQGPGACQLPFIPTYVPCGGWGALASTETINNLHPFAQVNNRLHPAFIFPEEQTRTGWNFPGRRPRIGRLPSNARRLQALSAIIESPRGGTPVAGSRNSPAATKGGAVREQEIQSASVEQLIAKPEVVSTDSPQIPPRSSSRPIRLTDVPPPKPLSREPSCRPRAARSKSLGTVSDPNKPNSTDTFASAPGPAPTGPLPPLPPLPRNISRHSDYNPANRHSALGIPSAKHSESTSTSLNSSPERNWERIVSSENINAIPEFKNVQRPSIPDDAAAGARAEASSYGSNSRPGNYIGHRRSLVCLSIISNSSNRNSVSSIASTLEKQSNRLSIPQILNVDRISISRVSSSDSLKGGVTMVSTPRRHTGSSRVSATGSPSEKPKPNVLRAVSGNTVSPQRPMKSALKDSSVEVMSKWEKSVIRPRHSILKGSPGARKGHRRQNCVRLSTLAPTVLGPGARSRSTSPSIDGIQEESPDRTIGPLADQHLNGDVTLRPRTAMDPLRLRASLTPSSPTLSMVAYQNEPLPWHSEVNSRRASYVSPGAKSALSREASLFSIPSLPDMNHVDKVDEVQQGSETPAIEFTRPSTEWSEHERSPPFGLHVTPSNSKRSVYKPEESPPLPSWSNKYDPSWPMPITNPPASGQEYDPSRPISIYSSDEEDSSSPNFPFALKDEPVPPTCSSPPSFLADYDDEKENRGRRSPYSEKEIESPYARAASLTQRIRSPFESMPILRPHASFMEEDLGPSLPSPPPSPNSSICKTPPPLCRAISNDSDTLTSPKLSIHNSSAHRRSSTSPHRRSTSSSPHRRSGGIDKPSSSRSKRVTGPRAQPPKDIRKSIMALRRMNSSLQVSEDEMGKGLHRYLHLGREASVQLPFDFGFSSDTEDDDSPPKDILLSEEQEESESRECHVLTYSPTKPTLSLLTTVPQTRGTRLSVWENGERYWQEIQENASTASPIETPTLALNKLLGWEQKDDATLTFPHPTHHKNTESLTQTDSSKGNLPILHEDQETQTWDKRKSKAMETPKSVRSLYDQQGFYTSP
ncbi:unnamed protein product [Aureobasidium uvarum]|uniref:Uncharacterized protein n=1 Tax=Aureobasidium uvarum TaxID=2773716 RepID=A0A9N8KM85_9PEZI|nr:unnamed protein product [Aureobasidium uvarum]